MTTFDTPTNSFTMTDHATPTPLTHEETEKALTTALSLLEKHAIAGGACIISLPSGQVKCVQLDAAACAAISGTYVGGPC